MFSFASASNIRLAIPACERIPTPTTDILAIVASPFIFLAPSSCLTCSIRAYVLSKSLRCTVKVKSVQPSSEIFCTIISISILALVTGPSILEATPGWSGTPLMVSCASSLLNAIPEIIAFSTISSSSAISVPLPSSKVDRTRNGTLYLPANSTERICRTFEPRLAISSISSKVM